MIPRAPLDVFTNLCQLGYCRLEFRAPNLQTSHGLGRFCNTLKTALLRIEPILADGIQLRIESVYALKPIA